MKLSIANCRTLIETRKMRSSKLITHHSSLITAAAFSLIEILVVMALLTVIVIGLMAMFGQTQRAFRTGMTQVDVLAAGRSTADMLARQLEQIRPAYVNGVNFYAEIPPNPYRPLLQTLPGANNPPPGQKLRTNVLEDLFFLT